MKISFQTRAPSSFSSPSMSFPSFLLTRVCGVLQTFSAPDDRARVCVPPTLGFIILQRVKAEALPKLPQTPR